MLKKAVWIGTISCLVFSFAGCAVVDSVVNPKPRDTTGDVASVVLLDEDGYDLEISVGRAAGSVGKRGIGYLRTEEWDQAIEIHRSLIEKKPTDARAQFVLGVCHEKLGDETKGDPRKALSYYQQALEGYNAALRLENSVLNEDARRRILAKLRQ